ncbi:MAG: hypothetical protein Kow0029_26390 [Candidatus Rifleibacteriota bacterium]
MIKSRPDSRFLLAILAGITGFAANLTQISLFRFFMGLFYGTEMHLGIFLAIWLTGISAGGFFGGKKALGIKWMLRLFILAILAAIISMFMGYKFLPNPEGGFLPFLPVALFMMVSTLPSAFLIGMLLPILLNNSTKSLGIFYGYEAIGGFFGGLFFSIILGGTSNSLLCLLSVLIIAFTALILDSPGYFKAIILVFVIIPVIIFCGSKWAKELEINYWHHTHQTLRLLHTVETPYQKLQLCSYYEQKSLFSNGMFSCSWPLAESSEKLVHSFMTALQNYKHILIIGAPPPDVLSEFLKYPDIEISVVELDNALISLYSYPESISSRVSFIVDDPRRFLNETEKKYDGIMIFPVSPVTLAGNRLFTIEAFQSMNRCLAPDGVLSLQVSGTENYLGSIKEQIILSTWQGLGQIFRHKFAIPGSTITFFACQQENIIPTDVKDFIKRFAQRKIPTTTFMPMSFYNILQPFRVKELEGWLSRPIKAKLNTDTHPESFGQQLELWNVYSGSSISKPLNWLQKRSLNELLVFVTLIGISILVILQIVKPANSITVSIAGGVAVSGATGLLCEIILILLYQNRHGAAYQMTSLFFGVYMLGLAFGAWLFGINQKGQPAFKRLKSVKFLQILFTLLCVMFMEEPQFHSTISIAAAIFIIAFLDGIEFPLADTLLRHSGRSTSQSAGILLFSDNLGALFAGLASGLWLLPTLGMKNCLYLLSFVLLLNAVILLSQSKNLNNIN